ncbi:unnamed protein product [Brugia pahangi]|uniref:HIT family protein n=1 Tax=Brugia pahangi TaxID=6280 RepID=A0A0N4THG5_BRUPA|nr:unnamed protein product [Brugia pahangi]
MSVYEKRKCHYCGILLNQRVRHINELYVVLRVTVTER